jgi:RNA polymerase sigma-70 factor (ECF subfamily)
MVQDTALAEFEQVRPRLFGIAYRMMGTATEAEDVLQDTWLRWQRTDRSVVRDPGAFLATTATRLAINALTSARATRETYIGPWLPEPVSTADDPALGAERSEALEMAVVLLLERLAPRERAAYVLREAFDYPYREIADLLETSEPNARQLVRRARDHIVRERSNPVDPEQQAQIMGAFLAAAQSGDLAGLESVLTDQVVSVSDGGGVVSAARVPIVGRTKVAHFVLGALAKFAVGSRAMVVQVNGAAAVLTVRDGKPDTVMSFDIGVDGISRLLFVRNPDKLRGLASVAADVPAATDASLEL